MGYKTFPICNGLYNKNFLQYKGSLLIIREEIIKDTFKLFKNSYKIEYNIKNVLEQQRFSNIYDGGLVMAFWNE